LKRYVFVATAIKAVCYLLTGRIAIATGYHIAWDFVLATVFGLGAQDSETTTAFFIIHSESVFRVDGNEISFILMGILIGLELVGLLLILKWVSLRYGKNPSSSNQHESAIILLWATPLIWALVASFIPTLVAFGLSSVCWHWNEFLWLLIITNSEVFVCARTVVGL